MGTQGRVRDARYGERLVAAPVLAPVREETNAVIGLARRQLDWKLIIQVVDTFKEDFPEVKI